MLWMVPYEWFHRCYGIIPQETKTKIKYKQKNPTIHSYMWLDSPWILVSLALKTRKLLLWIFLVLSFRKFTDGTGKIPKIQAYCLGQLWFFSKKKKKLPLSSLVTLKKIKKFKKKSKERRKKKNTQE